MMDITLKMKEKEENKNLNLNFKWNYKTFEKPQKHRCALIGDFFSLKLTL